MRLPKLAWWIIGIIIVLVIVVLLKVDISVGSGGLHITQGIVR